MVVVPVGYGIPQVTGNAKNNQGGQYVPLVSNTPRGKTFEKTVDRNKGNNEKENAGDYKPACQDKYCVLHCILHFLTFFPGLYLKFGVVRFIILDDVPAFQIVLLFEA